MTRWCFVASQMLLVGFALVLWDIVVGTNVFSGDENVGRRQVGAYFSVTPPQGDGWQEWAGETSYYPVWVKGEQKNGFGLGPGVTATGLVVDVVSNDSSDALLDLHTNVRKQGAGATDSEWRVIAEKHRSANCRRSSVQLRRIDSDDSPKVGMVHRIHRFYCIHPRKPFFVELQYIHTSIDERRKDVVSDEAREEAERFFGSLEFIG